MDYLVIGAGIAGLGAAYELKKAGKQVTVLEKNSYPGGRMSTAIIDGLPFDRGAKFITPFYKNIWRFSSELNLSPIQITSGNVAVQKQGKIYTFNPGNLFSLVTFGGLSWFSKIRLGYSLLNKLTQSRQLDLYDWKTWLHLDNKSVYEDMIELCGAECFDYFLEPMCTALFYYGTKNFSRALFIATLPKIFSMELYAFEDGIYQLCNKIANQVDVRYNISVTSIRKENNFVLIKAKNANKKTNMIIKTKCLIIAVPGNKVLSLLVNPTDNERIFFSQLDYSSTIAVLCKTTRNLLDNTTVWLPEKEFPYFTSIGSNWYQKYSAEKYFEFHVRSSFVKELTNDGLVNKKQLIKRIQQQLGKMKSLEIVEAAIWDSALPIMKAGYFCRLNQFLNDNKNEKRIFYCGDYLENPSTEGALTSGLKAAQSVFKK